jgi:uncharacterized protein YceH (UPF0502 family)
MDVSKAIKELSEPHSREEKIDAIIARCARLAGLKYSRCYEIYYGRARRIEAAEIARISEALEKKQAGDIRNELSELRLRLTRLEALLSQTDAQVHRPKTGLVKQRLR